MFTYLYNAVASSPLLLGLMVAYLLAASVTAFDVGLLRAKRAGILPPDEPELPKWVAGVYWIEWALIIAILILNWKFGIVLWLLKVILKVLPVLDTIGNIIMAPFKPRDVGGRSPARIPATEEEKDELVRSIKARLEQGTRK
jgi:hypothetical protein